MRRGLALWAAPVALAASAAGCFAMAPPLDGRAGAAIQVGEARANADAAGQPRLSTPVLSARRAPAVLARAAADRRTAHELAAWVAASPAESCLVVHDGDGRRVHAHRPAAPVVPASSQKLLTAAAALELLGEGHRFRTTVVAAGAPSAGVLAGDLHLVGGGDPVLATADYVARFRRQPRLFTDLDELAARLGATGLRRVEGAVVGDESRYDPLRYVPGWPARYMQQGHIGPLSALAVNDGFATRPGAPGAGGGLVAAPDPAANAAAVLTGLLEARGVEVVGEPRSGPAPPGAVELAAIESPTVADIVGQFLQESDNETAELLLKEIGLARMGEGSTAAGAAAVLAFHRESELPIAGMRVADGSGLSLDNRVTCELLVALLEREGAGEALVGSLAVAGRSGTLAERFDHDVAGLLAGKTGRLRTVTALTGALDDGDGRLSFAYVANAAPPGAIAPGTVALQDSLVEILLRWPEHPDLGLLGPAPPAPTGAGPPAAEPSAPQDG